MKNKYGFIVLSSDESECSMVEKAIAGTGSCRWFEPFMHAEKVLEYINFMHAELLLDEEASDGETSSPCPIIVFVTVGESSELLNSLEKIPEKMMKRLTVYAVGAKKDKRNYLYPFIKKSSAKRLQAILLKNLIK